MTRVDTTQIAGRLFALGFSMAGAQQIVAGHPLADAKDRRHLALFVAGLFEGRAIEVGLPGGRAGMRTQSGLAIEFDDDAAGAHTPPAAGPAFARAGTAPVARRTSSGMVIGFDDDAA